MASQTVPKLPVVDFTKGSLKPGSSLWLSTCNDVRHALEEYGCFVALYDKVSSELDKEVFGVLKDLFDLPTQTKVQNTSDKLYYGYVGQLPCVPIHESMGIEEATTLEGLQNFTNLMWADGNDHFCETMLSYAKVVSELEQKVNRMVFESYGVEKNYESHVGSTTYLLRVMKYRAPQMNESEVGSETHTDKSFITILHQNQVNALEVQARNGQWIAVDFPLASFVVMAGDAYMAWSNDRIHSPRHQVKMSGNKPRYAMALFSYRKGIVQIPEELVDDKHPLQFKPFDNFGLLDFYLTDPSRLTESSAKAYCGISV